MAQFKTPLSRIWHNIFMQFDLIDAELNECTKLERAVWDHFLYNSLKNQLSSLLDTVERININVQNK